VRSSQSPSRADAFENNTLRSVVTIQKAYNRFKLYATKDKRRRGSGPINVLAEPSLARMPPVSLYGAAVKRNAQFPGTGNLPVHRQLIFSNTDVRISNLENRNNSYVVFFLLCDSPASEFYVPTFRNIKFRGRKSPKRKYTIFRTWRKFEMKNSDVS
jgi:hypothetical protein